MEIEQVFVAIPICSSKEFLLMELARGERVAQSISV